MANKKKPPKIGLQTADYRHTREKRTNIPPAKIASEGKVPSVANVRYQYSPHLTPILRFDTSASADALPTIIAEAGRRPLTEPEQRVLRDALRNHEPWMEWAGKREQHERGFFDVDPVALHIHERISTQAMLRVLAREDVQRSLFADPEQPYSQAVQFYKHPVDWANRLILGDSLQVMTSLARREHLADKVQMIYVDPPYGIKFKSNFMPKIGHRNVKDMDQDLTREPEMVRAYRDTWRLGVHSFLTYLRDRLMVARELLNNSGSLFLQISEDNLHRVRVLLDELFGSENFVALIPYRTNSALGAGIVPTTCDYVLWYARHLPEAKFRPLFVRQSLAADTHLNYALLPTGEYRRLTDSEKSSNEPSVSAFRFQTPGSSGFTPSCTFPFEMWGRTFVLGGGKSWRTTKDGMRRLALAHRLIPTGSYLNFVQKYDDFPFIELSNLWADTHAEQRKAYVVQTSPTVIERCLLMTTDPGDLVLDPTCGGGTTAFVAEHWGRRWLTCDTSRVALSLARQRLMTASFPFYRLRDLEPSDLQRNPNGAWLSDSASPERGRQTFAYKTVPHITLGSIAQNAALDAIFSKHETMLQEGLASLNRALSSVPRDVRVKLKAKLAEKEKREGKRAITESDERRWILPEREWREWEVPFDADQDWPKQLQEALTAYRGAWRAKMDEVNGCISRGAEMEELVDRPEELKGVVRISGPFTVEGVRPEELSLGEDGLFDPTPNEFEGGLPQHGVEQQNLQAYLSKMIQHLRSDGVSFMDNTVRRFAQVEALFDSTSGSVLHAEGTWDDPGEDRRVAVSFGPESGPVTALQLEEAIREARQYDELVIAGFSFDAEVPAVVAEQSHPRLRIHQAFIRPDLNSAMDGLLRDTARSQLFTVFGQPDVDVKQTGDEWVCTLAGVSIYDPLENMVRSTGAEKVAAWFLDSDFDGRCFCITQAFFPDQSAWGKIAKALGASAEGAAFERLKGTTSLPFRKGRYGRIAAKVIDPRGNEVMAIRKLE